MIHKSAESNIGFVYEIAGIPSVVRFKNAEDDVKEAIDAQINSFNENGIILPQFPFVISANSFLNFSMLSQIFSLTESL